MDGFLDGLDLLLEQCDGLTLKHAIRVKARERRLDVVFAGDERGFLSLEPYGQSPQLQTFHGRVTAPQPPREAYETPLDFMRALSVWLGGWEALSGRSRDSIDQIGMTLCGILSSRAKRGMRPDSSRGSPGSYSLASVSSHSWATWTSTSSSRG